MARAIGGRANRRARKSVVAAAPSFVPVSPLELLESRQLLSAALIQISPSVTIDPQISSQSSSNSQVTGYTPAQIRTAYGFNNISFNGTTGNGSGQTIAIVDAYNDPDIKSDLNVFDQQFGIAAPPSFSIVSQTGSTKLPATNASWAQETSLDVEWAHAIAPGANIVLVESKDETLSDLIKGVNYARNVPGVSIVSMSWGSAEFSNEQSYDKYFTTPSGHIGVTFVAAAGDDGADGGAEWPACSPNVVSVGGTTLNLNSNSTISSETVWSDTSGGTSTIEPVPTFQVSLGVTGRTTADVSYDADPNTGFATYDSLAYEGQSGWAETGGTSAGTPQWSALIAIADQGRAIKGYVSLDGATGTLPAIYNVYNNATSYAADFNDITSGSNASDYGGDYGGGGGGYGGGGYGGGGYGGGGYGGGGYGGGGYGGGGGGWHHGGHGFGGFPFVTLVGATQSAHSATTSTTTTAPSVNSAAIGYDIPSGVGTPKASGFIQSLISAGVSAAVRSAARVKVSHAIKVRPAIEIALPPPPQPQSQSQSQSQSQPQQLPPPVLVSQTLAARSSAPAIGVGASASLTVGNAIGSSPANPFSQAASGIPIELSSKTSDKSIADPSIFDFLTDNSAIVTRAVIHQAEKEVASAASAALSVAMADAKAIANLTAPLGNSAVSMAPEIFSVIHIDAAATFADAISSFADESAAMPALRTVAEHSNARAWALTGLVLAADAMIIARYRKQRAGAAL